MAYLLDSTEIRRPYEIEEGNSTQVAQQRTLRGSVTRDFFGSNKRIWRFTYRNTKKADFDAINTIYQSYLGTGDAKTFQSTEANYLVSLTSVHIDLQARQFRVRGSDYLSDFVLTLSEA